MQSSQFSRSRNEKRKMKKWRAARGSHPIDRTRLVKMRSCVFQLLIRSRTKLRRNILSDRRSFPFVALWVILVISQINREIQGNVFKSFTMKLRSSSA